MATELTTDQQAAEALAAAVAEDGLDNSPEAQLAARVDAIKSENKPDVAAVEVDEGTTFADSFSNINPNDLSPELLAQYKNMQAEYTQSKQSLAKEREQWKSIDEYGGLDVALEAVQFAQNLASDPEFALQVQDQLFTALTDAGMSPKAAAAEVERQVEAVSDTLADYDDDDPLVKQLKAVEERLSGVTAWQQQQDSEAANRQLAAQIQLQENEILAKNPDYVQADLDDIYALAYSTGGNLIAAEKLYETSQKRILDSYLSRKASVSTGVSGIASNGVVNADAPTGFTSLYDPGLEALVQERLAQEIAAGNV